MCGIAGILTSRGDDQRDRLGRMLRALNHRGPDGEGIICDAGAFIGMRRLSVIDLEGGNQPLFNESKNLALIVNGEIYNHIELRNELIGRGHTFSTHSDCEPILHLYEEEGMQFLQKLRGMFAFALFDQAKRIVILARDRMGEKPLYLAERDGVLAFASEIKALLASGIVGFSLDVRAIDAFWHYGYVPEPLTPIKGIRKLDAAHYLVVHLDSLHSVETRYWNMEDAPPLSGNPVELIRNSLDEICDIVIRSDVPVGIALSGGLDSSLLATLISKRHPGLLSAFSIGYPERPSFDERGNAQQLARDLNLPFHELELTTESLVNFFPSLVKSCDDPISDLSSYGYFSVMRLAREHGVPVMIQGHGGDELFWGYPWVRQAVRESRLKNRHTSFSVMFAIEAMRQLLPAAFNGRHLLRWMNGLGGIDSLIGFLRRQQAYPQERMIFYDLVDCFDYAQTNGSFVLTSEFLAARAAFSPADFFTFDVPWPREDVRLTKCICDLYLRENGMAQGDRLSMASSVELRLPLVDYRLVETVVGLRKSYPDDALSPKEWLREAVRNDLPDYILNRPKRGFQPPILEWQSALLEHFGPTLCDGYLTNAGIIRSDAISQLLANAHSGGKPGYFAYSLLVLETWCREMSAITCSASTTC